MTRHTMRMLAGAAATLSLLAAGTARAEENLALWNKRMPVAFGGYAPPGGGAPLTNFPALVVLGNTAAGAGFDYSDFGSPPYGDLRFAAADMATPLDFEVESWDTEGLSHVWVKVPELTADTTIYALWGRSGVAAPPCTTNGVVWCEGYAAVWHLNESGTKRADATAKGNTGTTAGNTAYTGNGAVAGASLFDGTGDYIGDGQLASINGSAQLTVSGWLNLATLGGSNDADDNGLFSRGAGSSSIVLWYNVNEGSGDQKHIYTFHVGNTGTLGDRINGNSGVAKAGRWQYVAGVMNGNARRLYIDGLLDKSATTASTTTVPSDNVPLRIGAYELSTNFDARGGIDEVRISTVERSADWVWACWMNQGSNGVFNAVGAPEFQDLPFITNPGGATNATAGSAWLNGALVATGTSATAVSVHWGTTDGGTNASDWEAGAHWLAPQEPGAFTVQATGLDADAAYFYRFTASNAAGVVWAESSPVFITGEVRIEQMADALELGQTPGTFTVHRAVGAVGCDLVVGYAVGGTATPGTDYAPLGGALIIPAGETSAPLVVAPVFDRILEEDETVSVTLLPGPYILNADSNAVITVANDPLEAVWDGSGNMTWTQPDATSWSGGVYDYNSVALFAGAGQGKVTLSGTITPSAVRVTNGAYTLAGTAIAGAGGLTVSGGALVIENAANTYAGDTVVGSGATLQINQANRLPYGAGKGDATVDGTLIVNNTDLTLNGLNGAGLVEKPGGNGNTLTLGADDASGAFGGVIRKTGGTLNVTKTGGGAQILGGANSYNGATTVNGGTLRFTGANTLSGALTVNAGVLALDGSNTLSGAVTADAGGALRLGHPQALRGAPLVTLVGGGTLDTAEMAEPVFFAAPQTLRLDGRGATATLETAPGNGLELTGTSALHVNAYDGATPALTVTGGGSLTLSSGNTATVTVAGDTPLAPGDYLLVADGAVGEAPAAVTVNGAGRAPGTTAALVIEGGSLVLRIEDYDPGRPPASVATTAAGDWHAPATWSGGSVPGPGDTVTLDHPVTLTSGTSPLAGFVNNATLTFNGWNTPLVAAEVAINAGMTHPAQSATARDPVSGQWIPDNRVWIICSNLMVTAGGKIMLDARGYQGRWGYGLPGYGPGGGAGSSGINGGGGGHGGRGGLDLTGNGNGGPTNGVASAPENPGSAGGCYGGTSGSGGGALRIDAAGGAVTIDGTISADGQAVDRGGGAGGSVWITCRTIGGGGAIRANGGASTVNGGGGGGGRIAVLYDTAAQAALPLPELSYAANGGASLGADATFGDIGTLSFPDARFLGETITWPGQWVIPGLDAWSPASLTVSNAWTRFPADGFTCTVAGDVVVAGPDGRLDIGGMHYDPGEGRGMAADELPQSLHVDGDLTISDGAALYVYAAVTSGIPGEAQTCVEVGGDMRIASNCWVYPRCHNECGAIPFFAADRLFVAAGGGFDADAHGFKKVRGFMVSGRGPGHGKGASTQGGGGAGYGGKGGMNTSVYGQTYGCSNAPLYAGSSGGNRDNPPGGNGGGAICIRVTRKAELAGALTANGQDAYGGGGSGGTVFVRAGAFNAAPGASISANGGASTATTGGGGGGGRVAVWSGIRPADEEALLAGSPESVRYPLLTGGGAVDFQGTTTVAGGTGATASGEAGSVVYLAVAYPSQGTILLLQ